MFPLPQSIAIYINDDLKYQCTGSFQTSSFIKFSDFGQCSGPVVNDIANVQTRAATAADLFLIFEDFNNTPLTGWTQSVSHGAQFSQNGNAIRIIHSTSYLGLDNIQQSFAALPEAVIEFDAKIGSVNNDNFSLLVESDDGYAAPSGLGLAFKCNSVMTFVNNNWQTIGVVPFDAWQHYRIVSTAGWIAIYVNSDLKYQCAGSFQARSLIKFSDFGMCSGPVTNYLANVLFRPVTDNDRFIDYDDFATSDLTGSGWLVSNLDGTQFAPQNGQLQINHVAGTWEDDYLQRTFAPMQDVIVEFDAQLGSSTSWTLSLESDDTASTQSYLAFYQNNLQINCGVGWQTVATVNFNEWHHYRIVYTATAISVYVDGNFKYAFNWTFNPRTFFRFVNMGYCTATNYIQNFCIRPWVPENDSSNAPDWTSDWMVVNPGGTQFIQDGNQYTINQVAGTPETDYLQRNFMPLQNVSFEFDAQIGSANNTGMTLMIESDGGSGAAGYTWDLTRIIL